LLSPQGVRAKFTIKVDSTLIDFALSPATSNGRASPGSTAAACSGFAMCELLGMASRYPATLTSSLERFARRGG
jgi:hypothetical protein